MPSIGAVTDQYRLTVAVFDDAASLWGALDALLQDGIRPEQLCLLAHAETMPRLDVVEQEPSRDTFSEGWMPPLKSLPAAAGDRTIVATDGPLLHALTRARAVLPERRAAGSATVQGLDLADYVLENTVTLVVRSLSPAQQSLTARTLLSRSSHRVRTFEFALPVTSTKAS